MDYLPFLLQISCALSAVLILLRLREVRAELSAFQGKLEAQNDRIDKMWERSE